MGLNDLFTVKSKAQARQEALDYEKMIFPFGEVQKDKRRQFFMTDFNPLKGSSQDAFYHYIVYRQLLAEGKAESGYSEWYHSGVGKFFSHEEKAVIRAYAELDFQLRNADEEIDQKALTELTEKHRNEAAPEKPGRKRLIRF